MKKLIWIMLTVVFLSGCTVVRIDTASIDNTINVILSKNNTLYNRVGKGYKYYVPRGVTYIDTNELNEKLYSNGTYYYLYIDAIRYYHKAKSNYQENPDAYYSRALNMNGKTGYLEINEMDGKYLIEFMYNYSKIEALVDKQDINETVLNASYILSTVKFNHNVIKLMMNENSFVNKEEKYDIFDTTKKDTDNNFLQYDEEEAKRLEAEAKKNEEVK
ncbi:MAG: hypothetical protein HFG15_01530 [Bacilli bacterium]|nr:hypothetical protein [Bacilli bacterium]